MELSVKEKLRLSKNKKTPEQILRELAYDKNEKVKLSLLKRNNLPLDIYIILSKDKAKNIREALSENINTPSEALENLKSGSIQIRSSIAKHHNISNDLMLQLSKDSNEKVRASLVSNENMTMDLLEDLSCDNRKNVKIAVIKQPLTPLKILEKFISDSDDEVRENLVLNEKLPLEYLKKFIDDRYSKVKKSLLNNKNMTEEYIDFLAKNRIDFRKWIAESSNTSLSLLLQMVDDDHIEVIRNVANNTLLPSSVLELLCKNKDELVAINAMSNTSLNIDFKNRYFTTFLENNLLARKKLITEFETPSSVLLILAKLNYTNILSDDIRACYRNLNMLLDLLFHKNNTEEVVILVLERISILYKMMEDFITENKVYDNSEYETMRSEISFRIQIIVSRKFHDIPVKLYISMLNEYGKVDLISDKNTSEELLLELFNSIDLSSNPIDIEKIGKENIIKIEKLFNQDIPNTKLILSLSPFTSAEILEILCKDTDLEIQLNCIYNINTPSHILTNFLHDENILIKKGAALNLKYKSWFNEI